MIQNHSELSARTFVDVHAIQEELDQVRWGLHANGEGSEAAQHAAAEARASVCNLIAVVGNEPELGEISSVLDRLSVTNPSRTLILLAQHTREADKLEAQVSAQERTESGHRVSTERVILHAHGEPARHLASLAAPLLIPDLPVILWWTYAGFWNREPRPRGARAFGLTLVPFFALWVAYNVARWHVPWDAGHTVFYHQDPYMGSATGSPFSLANVPVELFSFFVVPPGFRAAFPFVDPSPFGTALWFTSPALVLAFFAREPRRLVLELWLATALVAGPSLLYYANGGSQYGMRHALDFEPFVLVLMGLAVRAGLKTPVWRVAQVLIVWSAAAGVYGCWFWNTYLRQST